MKTYFTFDVINQKLEMTDLFIRFLSGMSQLYDIVGVGENWDVNATHVNATGIRNLCCCLQNHILLFNLTTV